MTCAELHDRLDDYIDGLLSEAEFQAAELHLAACDACRREERRWHALVARAAALPREIAPGRDLWPGIEGRLRPRGTRLIGLGWPFGRRAAGDARWGRWLAPALATAAAVLALALWPRAGRTPGAGTGGQAHPISASGEAGGLSAAEADYARATAELMEALETRRATLPPATAASVDDNLRTIDTALGDIRAALDQDPQNAQLARLLNATHRRKVAFLRQLVRLSTQL
jgi:anti-sigma factor RsiW